jgi:formate-dependent phosphoribosylglycinamide formyltransferase (GAR transformylase)
MSWLRIHAAISLNEVGVFYFELFVYGENVFFTETSLIRSLLLDTAVVDEPEAP